jgi:organic radical activating enzyme
MTNEDEYSDYVKKVKEQLNKFSPSLCLAKWDTTTIYLQTGETHSCHHPVPHKIPLEEIIDNPGALHNTKYKKEQRKDMLAGVRPKECQYCWNIEDLGDEYLSDRHLKSAIVFNKPLLIDVVSKGSDYNINPSHVEISFGNECQMSCLYCSPKISSSFYKEIEQFGPYPSVTNKCQISDLNINKEEDNPYVKAWWEWYPELSKTLTTLRVTGGEPLLHQSFWKLLDFLEQQPNTDLELMVNSNLSVKEILVLRLVTKVDSLLRRKKIKSFKLFTSLDTWGDRAEYIRNGLDLTEWNRNFHHIMTKLPTTVSVSLMITYNLMSVSSFYLLLSKILEWRKFYRDPNGERIKFDTPYLREPVIFDMNILPKSYTKYQVDCLKFMLDNKFSSMEIEKFKRVAQYMASTNYNEAKLTQARKDFYIWITESDRRKNKNFLNYFPEMTDFYLECKQLCN